MNFLFLIEFTIGIGQVSFGDELIDSQTSPFQGEGFSQIKLKPRLQFLVGIDWDICCAYPHLYSHKLETVGQLDFAKPDLAHKLKLEPFPRSVHLISVNALFACFENFQLFW